MKNGDYITILGWMSNELKLSGNELMAYAVIYGFTKDGTTEYKGSSRYLSEVLNVSKNTAINTLNSLTEKNLIIKRTEEVSGVVFNRYSANLDLVRVFNNCTGVYQKLDGGIPKIGTSNNKGNTKGNNKDNKEYDISSLHSDISNKKDEPSLDTIDLLEVNPDKDRTGKDSIGKDTDKPPIPKVPYEKIRDLYNSICLSLPKCSLVSEKRKTSIKAVTSKFQTDQIEEAFRKAEASDFLTGRSKAGWTGCSFDWLMNTNNMLKVLEGNYDNRGKHEFTEDDFVLE